MHAIWLQLLNNNRDYNYCVIYNASVFSTETYTNSSCMPYWAGLYVHIINARTAWGCHVGFGPPKILVPGSNFSGKFGPPGPIFLLKILARV